MKLFTSIATAAVIGTGLVASTTPAFAQYSGHRTFTFQQRSNGFRVRDDYGNGSIFTNRGGGEYNFRNLNGGYGSFRFRND